MTEGQAQELFDAAWSPTLMRFLLRAHPGESMVENQE